MSNQLKRYKFLSVRVGNNFLAEAVESDFGNYVKFEDVEPLIELLKESRGWVVSYQMQTYSKAAGNFVNEIDEALSKIGKGE